MHLFRSASIVSRIDSIRIEKLIEVDSKMNHQTVVTVDLAKEQTKSIDRLMEKDGKRRRQRVIQRNKDSEKVRKLVGGT